MSNDHLLTKIYKRCESCCMKCRQCREFEKIIEQIDLEERSALDRQRNIDKERSRDA
jgi:hypothetical protein